MGKALVRISHWRVGSSKESCLFFCANFPISTSNLSSGFSLLNTCIDILELSVRDNHLQVTDKYKRVYAEVSRKKTDSDKKSINAKQLNETCHYVGSGMVIR